MIAPCYPVAQNPARLNPCGILAESRNGLSPHLATRSYSEARVSWCCGVLLRRIAELAIPWQGRCYRMLSLDSIRFATGPCSRVRSLKGRLLVSHRFRYIPGVIPGGDPLSPVSRGRSRTGYPHRCVPSVCPCVPPAIRAPSPSRPDLLQAVPMLGRAYIRDDRLRI